MYDFAKFTSFCSSGRCPKKSIYNKKTCNRENKQKRCYDKYSEKKQNRIIADAKYTIFVIQVWKDTFKEGHTGFSTRDDWENYCQIWAILSEQERNYVKEHYKDDLWLNINLDVAHIREKDIRPDLKYDPDNGVVIGRYFHSLIDQFRHPVTRKAITKEERYDWLMRAKAGIK